jgi:erythromycin esterase-like protein
VRGTNNDANADAALADFKRFPQWMWRTSVLVEFVEWLGKYNDQFANDAMKPASMGSISAAPQGFESDRI